MSTPVSIHACLTTRDGAVRNDVMELFFNAVSRARRAGLKVGAGRQQFNHGTAVCRNKAVADFLAHTDCTHLLFVDDDVLLPADALVDLADALALPGVDVACGAYPTFRFVGKSAAHLYLTARPVGGDWLTDWPAGPVEVDAGGTGCMAIRRDVFAAVGFPWFRWPEQHDPVTGTVQWVSDDVDFCAAARAKGFRVWCDGRVRPGHLKLTDLGMLVTGALKWREAPPAAGDGYGSHVGALRLVARAVPVRVAVEYGAGRFSTPLFLDRAAFPDLERLVSHESDPEWADLVRRANPDGRLELRECPLDEMPGRWCPRGDADLVFIDCDAVRGARHDYSVRARLIEQFAADPRAVVVVHDANFTDIAAAVRAAPYKFRATFVPRLGPHTALLSNAVDVTKIGGRGAEN